MSQLQSEIPVRSWMTQIITTLTNHSPGRTGSSSRTTWTIFSHVASFDGKLFLFKNHNVLSVQNIIRSLIPTNLKVGYFSKGIQGGHLVCLMKWMRIFIYCKQHKRNAINSEKKLLLTGLWCTQNSNLSSRLGSLTQPWDNLPGQGCILVSVFLHWCSYLLHPIPRWCIQARHVRSWKMTHWSRAFSSN